MAVVALPEILEFEWDTGNEQKNWITHHVSAEERVILEDIWHSTRQEVRFILIRKRKQGRMLFVVYTIRKEKIRIISSRYADKKEVLLYEKALSLTGV